jgi:hypothetical protein
MVNAKRSTQVICHKNGRPKVFYKITNHLENHNEFQYKEGLNILKQKFDPKVECGKGGLYITDIKNLHEFIHFGSNVREIHIPKDAKIKSFSNKHKVDKLIFLKKYSFFEFIKKNRLHKNFNNKAFIDYIFRYSVEHDNIPKVLDILRHSKCLVKTDISLLCYTNPGIFEILLNENYFSICFLKELFNVGHIGTRSRSMITNYLKKFDVIK